MAPAEVFASDGDARADRAGLRVGLKQLASGPATTHHQRDGWQMVGAVLAVWAGRLVDEPRVGAPHKISDQRIEEVVTKTLESMPANSTHLEYSVDGRRDRSHRTQLCGSGAPSNCSRIERKNRALAQIAQRRVHSAWNATRWTMRGV